MTLATIYKLNVCNGVFPKLFSATGLQNSESQRSAVCRVDYSDPFRIPVYG